MIVTDIDDARAAELAIEFGVSYVPTEVALETSCDVFAPCAIARVVSEDTLPRFNCRIITGAANDTLADGSLADGLAARGITYVPDFVANAGGVIHIHAIREDWSDVVLEQALLRIGDRVAEILEEADTTGATPLAVAELRARRIISAAAAATNGRRQAFRPPEPLAA